MHRRFSGGSPCPAPSRRRVTWVSALIGAILLVLSSCSNAGDVWGSVFVTTWAGELKELADLEIALVPRSKGFEDEWQALRLKYGDQYRATSDASADSAPDASLRGKLADIETAYLAARKSFFGSSAVARARTDAHGAYRFPSVTTGSYYLFCEARLRGESLGWMVPVEVLSGGIKIDLSNGNEGALRMTSAGLAR